ncbi:TRAP transporter fused permease subunit [Geodermatophilus sp. YIM 151500]|uniref:TRAP transporter permease n=1 Tax=Geodermatophilus sp. YIM 151500 TaxID=2984531 RepID=UPI0021E3ED30|nr:TRAP transporter fused permease subunit [Geodermatophilus sp. YIM 151500]MCV2488318.1 TRAP transporter fused permease subunit [Geodermatophilus sp. YIM 151500]
MRLPGRARARSAEDDEARADHLRHDVAHHAAHRQGGVLDAATLHQSKNAPPADDPDMIDEEKLLAEFEAEKPARTLSGIPGHITAVFGVALSLFALYWVFNPMPRQVYLPLFLGLGLFLTFLTYRGWGRSATDRAAGKRDNPNVLDWVLAGLSLVPPLYIVNDWQGFFRRAILPTDLDLVMGTILILLTLEAARRTVGVLVPVVVLGFLAYAYFGASMPSPFTTADFQWPRLVGHNIMGTQGVFGTPLDVAATYIILFTIYGAVLAASGATRFFIDLSFAAFGQSPAGPGRTVTLSGFLLGTVSGSGVATTVTLGGISWPLLKRAGYPAEHGGGVLAAAGIGAILSPPTLGAAAFIIAEYLQVSYLEVLIWATIPTILYYLGIILAIEMDARRHKTHVVDIETQSAWKLLLRYGYHFSSLGAIVLFLVLGYTPFRAVVYATALAFVLAFFDRQSWFTPKRIWQALSQGATGALSVIPVMAVAGLIVGVMTLTGLALRLAGIIVDFSNGNVVLTAIFSAIVVVLLGLAVPVTASFIISFVVISPALQQVGVEPFAAAMFIFYYAVLSEVSPPTALSPFAAAAITGGKPVRTMWLTWKYTLPAFLVPFIFVLSPNGIGLLFEGGIGTVAVAFTTAVVAVACLAVVTGSWLLGPARIPERVLFFVAAVALLVMEPTAILIGAGFAAAGVAVHLVNLRRHRERPSTTAGAGTPEPAATGSTTTVDALGGGKPSGDGPASPPEPSTEAFPAGAPRTEK